MIANAGVILTGVEGHDEEAIFRLSLDVLLVGVWNTIQMAAPHFIEPEEGVLRGHGVDYCAQGLL